MLTGWQKIGSYWYFLRPARDGDHPEDPRRRNGSRTICIGTICFRRKRQQAGMLNGACWEQIGGKVVLFQSGQNCQPIGSMMCCHWITENGKRYYLKSDGVMAANEDCRDRRKDYKFDSTGEVM